MNSNEIKLERVTTYSKMKLENLMNLYLHDLSEFAADLKTNEEGKFEYEGLELYFESQDLNPYFIMFHNEVVGFILLNSGKYVPKDIDYVVHELFVLRSFRGRGIAGDAIITVLDKYKGKYKIAQLSSNKTAVNFWTGFYEKQGIKYTEAREKIDGLECNLQIFNV